MNKLFKHAAIAVAVACGTFLPAHQSMAAATIVVVNNNAPGVGFNDATLATPVGGNPGTTLGAQRLFAFTYAANIWGAALTSSVPIVVNATFEPLTCTSSTATLGSAGSISVFSDFPGAIKAGAWYSGALANKLSGVDQDPGSAQIRARFNSNLGNSNCLSGSPFYLGVDGNHGTNIDLVATLLHEIGHGVGFQTFTNGQTGAQLANQPSVWDHFMRDAITGKLWVNMTAAERIASAIAGNKLSWTGAGVTAAVPNVLMGAPVLQISGPAAGTAAGAYAVGTASYGPAFGATPISGQLMPVVDQADGTGLACNPLTGANALAVNGRIALIDRGVCSFVIKVKNAQNAGAVAVVIADNTAGSPPPGLGGADATITIPSIRITQADGVTLKAQLTKRSRTSSGVVASFVISSTLRAGTDSAGRALLYTPNPFQPGSSVSHFDNSAFPNLLMEPAINGDLTQSVLPPQDLTFKLLQDIGW